MVLERSEADERLRSLEDLEELRTGGSSHKTVDVDFISGKVQDIWSFRHFRQKKLFSKFQR